MFFELHQQALPGTEGCIGFYCYGLRAAGILGEVPTGPEGMPRRVWEVRLPFATHWKNGRRPHPKASSHLSGGGPGCLMTGLPFFSFSKTDAELRGALVPKSSAVGSRAWRVWSLGPGRGRMWEKAFFFTSMASDRHQEVYR